MMDVTVLICTRNPRLAYLERVLAALRRQTLAPERWELVLLDNGSEKAVKDACDLAWHANARAERVERAGKIHAVVAGIRLSRGGLLIVVDDDNVLANDYLEKAVEFFAAYPFVGVANGAVTGVFETAPSPLVRQYEMNIGLRDLGSRVLYSLMPGVSGLVCFGAGMVARRTVAQHYLALVERDWRRLAVNSRSDDTDMALCAYDVGLAQAYCPTLHVDHLISSNRVTHDYLVHIAEQNSYGTAMVKFLRGLEEPARPRPAWYRRVRSFVRRAAARIETGALTLDEDRMARAWVMGRQRAERDYRRLSRKRVEMDTVSGSPVPERESA